MKKQKILIAVIFLTVSVGFIYQAKKTVKPTVSAPKKQTFDKPKTSIVKVDSSQLKSFKQRNQLGNDDIKPAKQKDTYIISRQPQEISLTDGNGKVYPNRQYRVQQTPNDSFISSQWYIDKISAKRAWDFSTGDTNVTTAVIDTGFALAHQDLSSQWAINSSEYGGGKQSNSLDDDGDGLVDNWRGWNFLDGNNNPQAGLSNPNSAYVSHGTATAGVIGAAGNNGIGIAGLSWQGKILPLQTMSDDGVGYTSDIAAAIDYAVAQGAKVVSMSMGTDEPDSFMQQSIDAAISAGVSVVAAAGNDGCDCILYPANYPNVIAVGSVSQADKRSSFSSYGVNLDLMAPGESILTTRWTSGGNAYGNSSGTSLAAPLVSGAVSLILSRKPTATPPEISQLLHLRSDAVSGQAAQVLNNTLGYGRLNAMKAASLLSFQNGALISGSDGKVYLVENGTKRYINSPTALASHRYSTGLIQRATDDQLADFSNGTSLRINEGTLISSSGRVYLIENGQKRWILSPTTLNKQAPKSPIYNVSETEATNYVDGESIFTQHNPGDLVENNGNVYLLSDSNGQVVKRHILSPAVMSSYGYKWSQLSKISNIEANSYADSSNLKLKAGSLVYDGLQNKLYVISINGSNHEKRWIAPSALSKLYPGRPFTDVSSTELASYSDGTNITDDITLTDGVIAQNSTGDVFQIQEGVKKYISSPLAASSNNISLNWVVRQYASKLDQLSFGTNINLSDGTLFEEGGKVYITRAGNKKWIISYDTFIELGYNKKPIYSGANGVAASLSLASPIARLPLTGSLTQGTDGKVYRVQGMSKHWIQSPLTLVSRGYSAIEVYKLGDIDMSQYSNGSDIQPRSGALVGSSDGKVYIFDSDSGLTTKSWILDPLILELLYRNVPLIYQNSNDLNQWQNASNITLD